MPATFYDLTAPTKSEPKGAGVQWVPTTDGGPVAGVLTVEGKRNRCRYSVCEYPADMPGRAWMLTKIDAGSDATESRYACFMGRDNKTGICECRGYASAGHCRHLEALAALLANGWL